MSTVETEKNEKTVKTEKIMLILNPVSGRMKSKTGLFEILDEIYRQDESGDASAAGEHADVLHSGEDTYPDRRVTVAPTMRRGHASLIAADAAAEGYDTVICCGGDGTFNETVTGLMTIPAEKRPPLGYISAGSTNDFATSMGLSGSFRDAARIAAGKKEIALDVGEFTPLSRGGASKRIFTYIASFGVFTAVSYSTSQTAKNLFGHAAYLVEGMKDLANLQPHHVIFDLPDGTRIEGDYVFGAIANTTSVGGILKLPADKVCMSDGLLELFLIHMPKNPAELQRIVSALLSQKIDQCPLIELYHVESVKVLLEEKLSWSLDGEEATGGKRIELKCLAGAIRLKSNS